MITDARACSSMLVIVAIGGVALVDIGPARAQDDDPCHRDLAAEQPDKAEPLLKRAYQLHQQLRYEETGQTYREALVYSQDPRIHLQAGIVFLNALRLLDAYQHLNIALRCGRDGIPESEYRDAQQMMKRVRVRLGQIEVENSEPGAEVRFNDKPWFSDAGTRTRMVVAGEYLITIKKPGFVTVLAPVTIETGKRAIVRSDLLSNKQATLVKRRWKRWQPWTLLGAGAFVAALGGGIEVHASRLFSSYGRDLKQACSPVCSLADQTSLQRRYDAATRENKIAVASMIIGGAAAITDLTLAFLNRPHTSRRPRADKADVKFVPMTINTGASVSVGISVGGSL